MIKGALTELDAVVAVARKGNFRAAATELGMSASALSHAISALEDRLGVRIFNRTTRSVSLSEAGERFLARVTPALSEIRDAMDEANSQSNIPTGTVRINTLTGAARQIMTPIVLEYMRRYPDMRVDIVTEGRLVDIVAEGFDAGIRLTETVPKDMVGVPVGSEQRFAVVGAPTYFASNPPPLAPTDLLSHRCIRIRMPGGTIYRWEFEKRGEALAIDVDGTLTLDEPDLMLEATLAGVGLAYLWEWYARPHIEAGRLIRVLKDWTPPFPGHCLYYPNGRHASAALRALIGLIREVGS
jgi:DNA-binding transcriptional LysR family regulator